MDILRYHIRGCTLFVRGLWSFRCSENDVTVFMKWAAQKKTQNKHGLSYFF